jgi:hypothetical protein
MVQEPQDLGLDANGRAIVAFNINVVKTFSEEFLEEIVGRLVAQGVGVFNTDIFASSSKDLPEGDGPFLTIVATGGTSPERTQNDVATPAYPRPSAQLAVHAARFKASWNMAYDAYNALAGIRNQTLTG